MNKSDRAGKREMSKREALREKRRKEQLRRRTLLIGGIVIVALIFAGALILSSQQSSQPEKITVITPEAVPNPQGLSMGDINAPVKVVEFADFQCPACMLFATQQEPGFVAKYVTTGKVYFTYLPFSFLDRGDTRIPPLNESHAAAEAASCAGDQNKFWDYHDFLYANQTGENIGDFTQKRLVAYAQALGLNMNQFNACYSSGKYRQKILDDYAQGVNANVAQTPSFLVNGKLVTEIDLVTTIDAQLVGAIPNIATPTTGPGETPAASATP
jgi:protein-disulfide isomerase